MFAWSDPYAVTSIEGVNETSTDEGDFSLSLREEDGAENDEED